MQSHSLVWNSFRIGTTKRWHDFCLLYMNQCPDRGLRFHAGKVERRAWTLLFESVYPNPALENTTFGNKFPMGFMLRVT